MDDMRARLDRFLAWGVTVATLWRHTVQFCTIGKKRPQVWRKARLDRRYELSS